MSFSFGLPLSSVFFEQSDHARNRREKLSLGCLFSRVPTPLLKRARDDKRDGMVMSKDTEANRIKVSLSLSLSLFVGGRKNLG